MLTRLWIRALPADLLGHRQFLALVEFESRKKKRAAKAASEYLVRFNETVMQGEDDLKKHLQSLNVAS